MKKYTLYLIILAALAIIIGGIGSIVFFKRAEQTTKQVTDELYTIKDDNTLEEVHLKLSGHSNVFISMNNSKEVTMQAQHSFQSPLTHSLSVSEMENLLTVSLVTNSIHPLSPDITFPILNFYTDSLIHLNLPSGIKKLIIEGDATNLVHVSAMVVTDLKVTSTSAEIVIDSVKTEQLSLQSKEGDISINNDTQTDAANIKTSSGTLLLDSFSALTYSVYSEQGDIYADNNTGTYTIETKSGNIYATLLSGDASLKSKNGDIQVTPDKTINTLDIKTKQGNIQLFAETMPNDYRIETQSSLGNTLIFNQEVAVYTKGNGMHKITLQNSSGDIWVGDS